MRLYSWNVNGVRAATKKGLFDWLEHEAPDVLCIQETKAHVDQLSSEILVDHGFDPCLSSRRRDATTKLYASATAKAADQIEDMYRINEEGTH